MQHDYHASNECYGPYNMVLMRDKTRLKSNEETMSSSLDWEEYPCSNEKKNDARGNNTRGNNSRRNNTRGKSNNKGTVVKAINSTVVSLRPGNIRVTHTLF